MEGLIKGDIVATLFPFSNLKSVVRRPALVLSIIGEKDVILCQITKKENPRHNRVELDLRDMASGSLKLKSFIRPSKLFTIDKSLILYKIGHLKANKLEEVTGVLIKMFGG